MECVTVLAQKELFRSRDIISDKANCKYEVCRCGWTPPKARYFIYLQRLMGKGVNDDNITNMVQDMMIAEVPLDSIHMRRSFLPPRISCVGGEGHDNQEHQEEAGNVLEVGVAEGRR